ncbi:hypothetical protein [Candidatus Tisiphia endosymbiont of Thecophora atra]|uniref:hypothetical protein n=1 Tax=Candidatus Tisiphia endosymbiont of Thecophora atra TaxID=3066258 RepID=UPI00312C8787
MISEPTSFSAGETVEWRRYLNKYPANEGWNLSYSFRNYTTSFDVAAIAVNCNQVLPPLEQRL